MKIEDNIALMKYVIGNKTIHGVMVILIIVAQ